MAEKTETSVVLTPAALKELITSAVESAVKAAKAPNVIEQQKLDEQQRVLEEAQRQRQATSQSVVEDLNQRRQMQLICSHEHKNGDSHCVFIHEKNGGYILCQKNQCKIRAGVAPENHKGNDIYDTALFNRLMQKLPTNELFQ